MIGDIARSGEAVTPNDNTDLPGGPGVLTCTASGNASVIPLAPVGGSTAITIYLTQGQVFPLVVKRVRSTSTTATGIVVLHLP